MASNGQECEADVLASSQHIHIPSADVHEGQLHYIRIVRYIGTKTTQDLEATTFMASAPNAESVGMLRVIEYDVDLKTQNEIRDTLAQNIPVLLVGWVPEVPVGFRLDDINVYRSPIEQTVSWQG